MKSLPLVTTSKWTRCQQLDSNSAENKFKILAGGFMDCLFSLRKLAEEMSIKQYDVVVFGASGFTGQFVVEELAQTFLTEGDLKWAIAGRDMHKLHKVLATASQVTGVNVIDMPVIIADITDDHSLLEMCQQARVVINCVGPYSLYGTAVVKACIDVGTSHIDICGEPAWMESTQLVYNSKAKQANVYILEACGFDCIPAEMGVLFTRKNFDGDLNGVESYVKLFRGPEGGGGNYGTWLSAVHGFTQFSELKNIRRQLYSTPISQSGHQLPKRSAVFYNRDVGSWCVPFVGADRSVVYSSEYSNWKQRGQRRVQFKAYFCLPNLIYSFFMAMFGLMFVVLTKFSFGIHLLKAYPSFFSGGIFTMKGPSRKQIAGSSFSMTFFGNGYSRGMDDDDRQQRHMGLPDKCIITAVSGPECGYVTTPICVVQAAYVLLKERDKLPPGGGVFTPGAAFYDTSLIERLERRGLHFSIKSKC